MKGAGKIVDNDRNSVNERLVQHISCMYDGYHAKQELHK
jgi:hypothetical protein